MSSTPSPETPARNGKKAIVIGAGVGGTATAARLAHAGFEVHVYEKNAFAGGRCSLIEHEGYRFDQGPSLLLLPPLFRQLYHDLGTTLEEHIDLVQCSPNYLIHYHDGETVTLSSDRAVMAAEADKWDGPGGAGRLEGFLAEARHHADLSYSLVLGQTFPSILSYLRPSFLKNVISLHPFSPLWDRCCRYFHTERMRRAFSFGSMYLGSSPFESPGTYSLLQWTETCEGIWYPKGGFQRVPASLQRIAESHGATFHFNTPVSTVLRDKTGKATGVRLGGPRRGKDEEVEVEADVVVVNADLVWAYNNLFTKEGQRQGAGAGAGAGGKQSASAGEKVEEVKEEVKKLLDPRRAKRLLGKPHSCSSISFYWAMDRELPQLRAHNIFLAEEYRSSFDDIFKHQSLPREASFYVNVPSRIDSTAAPAGKDAVVVLVPVGHLVDDPSPSSSSSSGGKMNVAQSRGLTQSQDWPALVEKARGQVIETMEKRLGIQGLRGMIKWEEVNTPLTWKEKFNLTHGSILGITHDFFNVLWFRHQARHPRVKDAYFVGASAHPGTGVPIAIAGSKLCAQAIFDDHAIPYPASYTAAPSPATSGDLDKRHARPLLYRLEDAFSSLFPLLLGALIAVALLLAVRAASGGAWDLFEYLDPRTLSTTNASGTGFNIEPLKEKTVIEEVVDKAQAFAEGNAGRGLVLSVPAILLGAGWMRAQRLRSRTSRRAVA